jgi:hypothetical protein
MTVTVTVCRGCCRCRCWSDNPCRDPNAANIDTHRLTPVVRGKVGTRAWDRTGRQGSAEVELLAAVVAGRRRS